jgi:hypothetical protein
MPKVRFICLANSRKNNGRCVAGICTDNQCWIRPISALDDGKLMHEYIMTNNKEACLLDEIEVDVVEPKPAPHQPENWLLGSPNTASAIRHLDPLLVSDPLLFGDQYTCIPYENFLRQAAQTSLALIEPSTIQWSIITNPPNDRRQARCKFELGGICYDLPITDPVFEDRASKLDFGNHTCNDVGITSTDRVFLTISLAEPFRDQAGGCEMCYKLVAAVLVLPK